MFDINWELIKQSWEAQTGLEWNEVRWTTMRKVLTETEEGKNLLKNLCFLAKIKPKEIDLN